MQSETKTQAVRAPMLAELVGRVRTNVDHPAMQASPLRREMLAGRSAHQSPLAAGGKMAITTGRLFGGRAH